MDPEIQDLMDGGIAALRIGNMEEARRKLMQVINADERNEFAWFYLSEAVESDEDRQVCLENVLAINPTNERAETELRLLRERIAREKANEGLIDVPLPPPVSMEEAVEQAPRFARHKSFMELLDTWGEMFTLPSRARLDEEHAYARWGLTVPGMLFAGLVTFFLQSLTAVGLTLASPDLAMLQSQVGSLPWPLPSLNLTTLLPCACGVSLAGSVATMFIFLMTSALFLVVARLFQGKGDFVVQSYLLSLVYGPYSLASGISTLMQLLMLLNPALRFIPILLSLVISIMALIMAVRVLKSAHGYGTGAALGTLFLPGIVLGCLVVLLVILRTAGSLTTSS